MEKKLTMVGLGRLGLSISLCFERCGWEVLGVDISRTRVNAVNSKHLKSREPMVEDFLRNSCRMKATEDLEAALGFSKLIYISVATPANGLTILDTNVLGQVISNINKHKVCDKNIVICATVMPGYIKNIAEPLICDCKRTSISYIPDGAVPISYGRLVHGISYPDMILIGEGSVKAGDELEAAHLDIVMNKPVVCRMNTTSAEITKLAISSMSSTKVSFSNYVADIAAATPNTDIHDILKCIGHDSRIRKPFISFGYGFGGPCIPRDTRALALHATEIGVNPTILNATVKQNEFHTDFLANRMLENCLEMPIIIEDVAFKQNAVTDVIDESRKVALACKLVEKGASVVIRDHNSVVEAVRNIHGSKFEYEVITKNHDNDRSPNNPWPYALESTLKKQRLSQLSL
jgi:UDPglucose 6-dehydrogenase